MSFSTPGTGVFYIPTSLKKGLIDKNTIIVEPTSGNQGIELACVLGKGKTVVTVLPDTAERYFSTPLFDEEVEF